MAGREGLSAPERNERQEARFQKKPNVPKIMGLQGRRDFCERGPALGNLSAAGA